MTDYPRVEIKWVDSQRYFRQDWHSIEDHDHSIATCTTVGLLVYEDDKLLTVALSTDGCNMIGDMTIPKVAILKRKKLA